MSQQTRINQFYQAVSQKMRPKTVVAVNSTPNPKVQNREDNDRDDVRTRKKIKLSLSNRTMPASIKPDKSTSRSNKSEKPVTRILSSNDFSDNDILLLEDFPFNEATTKTSRANVSTFSVSSPSRSTSMPSNYPSLPPKSPKSPLKLPTSPLKSPSSLSKSPSSTLNSPSKSPSKSPSSPKKSARSPKTLPIKFLKRRTPRRLFTESLDADLIARTVENLNLARSGLISANNFDLEKIYESGDYDSPFPYEDYHDVSIHYDVNKVNVPRDKHADHLFTILTDVFSDPLYCGYFTDDEFDMVFSILTLSFKSQMLLSRMIKRKSGWHRVNTIKYPEIDSDVKPYFDELESHNLCTSDSNGTELSTLLRLLRVEEVRLICQKSKVDSRGSKELGMQQLLKMANSVKSLFPGMESPAIKLRRTVQNCLGHCICLSRKLLDLINRIVMLFVPFQDVSAKLADLFLTLTMIQEGSMRYPEMPVKRYPIFENRQQFLRYVESRDILRKAIEAKEEKQWPTLLEIGREARDRVTVFLQEQSNSFPSSSIPRHVDKFREEYIWMKVVDTSLEVFKKDASTIPELVEILKKLINQKTYLQGKRGRWYSELALIEMHYNKNLDSAAQITLDGLAQENLADAARVDLIQRAAKLLKRRSVLNAETKTMLKRYMDEETLGLPASVTIQARSVRSNIPGTKSTWSLDMGDGGRGFMRVEERAMFHYNRRGFSEGWHCEGALPTTLFALALWEEIYGVSVPAAYLSPYQSAPLDLYTSKFYENRKEYIDKKIMQMETSSLNELCTMIGNSFEMRQSYVSLMPTLSIMTSDRVKEIVRCMGATAVVGICKRLASNFVAWRSGFPDLIVWNPEKSTCKIVEVKGPGDTLSDKQKLWIRYLEELGVDTELCSVEASGNRESRKNNQND